MKDASEKPDYVKLLGMCQLFQICQRFSFNMHGYWNAFIRNTKKKSKVQNKNYQFSQNKSR